MINARTDPYILGKEEALFRANKFAEIGVDSVFIEAMPDKATISRVIATVPEVPPCAKIIEGGKTENLSAQELAWMAFSVVAYAWMMVAVKMEPVRGCLAESFLKGVPLEILTAAKVTKGVGLDQYWEPEERHKWNR